MSAHALHIMPPATLGRALPPPLPVAGRSSARDSDIRLPVAGTSVLVVDADPASSSVFLAALSEYGDLRFATSAQQAERLLEERTPDLILLAAQLPDGSGFDFCAGLKASAQLRAIPVIAIGAADDGMFAVRAIESGATDFITKPLSPLGVQVRVGLHLRLKHQLDQLERLSVTDPLTELANRRALDEALAREWAGALRSGRSLSLVLADVDFFEDFNDAYGDPAGDRCLRCVSPSVRAVARRQTDLAARVDRARFALLLPDTPAEGAHLVGDALRRAVSRLELPHPSSTVGPHVSVSVGVCTLPEGAGRGLTFGSSVLTKGAAIALGRAKEQGGARCVAVPLREAVDRR